MKFGLAVALASVSFASAAVFLWDGGDGVEQVATGFDDGTVGTDGNPTNGYWYEFDDSGETPAGTSKFTWPPDVETDECGSFFGPMVTLHGGITGTANLTAGYTYPFLGVGFNIGGEDKSQGFDVSSWGGICVTYSSTSKFLVELGVANEGTVTKYNNYTVTLPASTSAKTVSNQWSDFKQEAGWGTTVPVSTVTSSLNALKFKFSKAVSGASNSFFIGEVGSDGQCDAIVWLPKPIATSGSRCTQGIRPHTKTQPSKVTLVGRSLSFSGVSAAANVDVISLQGQVLMAGKVGSHPMNLSKLNAGVYMVRVNGENVNFSQRVVLP